ncbi:hypothetical protein CICLE_v10033329mg, partial [Citrus x clementina]
MVDDKSMLYQIHEYHILVNNFKKEEIFLPERFVTGCLIGKLPESWRDCINTSKHKKKKVSLKDVITHISIKENNRIRDTFDEEEEFCSNATIMENTRPNK